MTVYVWPDGVIGAWLVVVIVQWWRGRFGRGIPWRRFFS